MSVFATPALLVLMAVANLGAASVLVAYDMGGFKSTIQVMFYQAIGLILVTCWDVRMRIRLGEDPFLAEEDEEGQEREDTGYSAYHQKPSPSTPSLYIYHHFLGGGCDSDEIDGHRQPQHLHYQPESSGFDEVDVASDDDEVHPPSVHMDDQLQ